MILLALILVPVAGGFLLWAGGDRIPEPERPRILGLAMVGLMAATTALAVLAASTHQGANYAIGGGIVLRLDAVPVAGVAAILVAVVTTAVAAYAAFHEPASGLARLLGLMAVFAGSMLLLVVAADLASLTVAWELVAGLSWALIGHDWRDAGAPRAAAHAFNTTRFGSLGLVLAAGAVFGATGSVDFAALGRVTGPALGMAAGGILLAAITKSAQVPFSPWLFSAMAGPTPVSALLHSSTMVAAGAYLLLRLQPVLAPVAWFAPTVVAIGLATALGGGVVAALQADAKKLLAASTSAHYGLMLVAIGAGYPLVALIHLVVHAVFKAQLFLTAGAAIRAAGTTALARMRVGRRLRTSAWLSAVGSLALAAIPPLGGAWSKEQLVAAATQRGIWLGVLVAVAGALSALYAARFQLLAFGGPGGEAQVPGDVFRLPSAVETVAVGFLASGSVALSLLWIPAVNETVVGSLGGHLPAGSPWEPVLSLTLVALALYGVWAADRVGVLAGVPSTSLQRAASDWLGIPVASRAGLVSPTLRLAHVLAIFDDRVVDAGVRAAASAGTALGRLTSRVTDPSLDRLVAGVAGTVAAVARSSAGVVEGVIDGFVDDVGRTTRRAGGDARRIQTGLVHHQFVVIGVGLMTVVLVALLGR